MKAIMEKKAVNKTVICLMVENQPNVLARISSLVGRRSFNISTITASETNVSGITKITLVVNGDDENVLYQIIAQMKKLSLIHILEGCLPLIHHPQNLIIQDDSDDWHFLADCCASLIQIHVEGGISCKMNHSLFRKSRLCADGCAIAIAHRSQTATGKKMSCFLMLDVLCRPHPVSYTHLDVYKRQPLKCPLCILLIFSLRGRCNHCPCHRR